MTKRIVAIAFIFVCATIAWAILGTTIFARTYDVGSNLASRVESTWGAPEEQSPPAIGNASGHSGGGSHRGPSVVHAPPMQRTVSSCAGWPHGSSSTK